MPKIDILDDQSRFWIISKVSVYSSDWTRPTKSEIDPEIGSFVLTKNLLLRPTQVKVDFGETEINQLPARICSFESYL